MFTANPKFNDNPDAIVYRTTMPEEASYISLAGTFIPMAIALEYYIGDKQKTIEFVKKVFENYSKAEYNIPLTNIVEIVGGYESNSAMRFLETSILEANIAGAICHEKYDYSHGRDNLAHNNKQNTLLYMLDNKSELDKMWLNFSRKGILPQFYIIRSQFKNPIINDFCQTV